ncbi:MAG: SAM-dependent methyltransferase [bacterium]
MNESATFLDLVKEALQNNSFIKLVLGKYRGGQATLEKITVRPVVLDGRETLSFVYRYQTKDVTRNFETGRGISLLQQLLGSEFKSAHLFSLTLDAQLDFSKKGKTLLSRSKPTCDVLPIREHDRTKERLIDPSRPFLTALGVTNERGQVLPSMSNKWKQINVFLERFQDALATSRIDGAGPVRIVDFGAGKGYLTFAVYDYLTTSRGREANVTGVEARDELVHFCNATANASGMTGLGFAAGTLASYTPGSIQVLIALHACDTATDQAMALGIRGGAEIIMCAPCCHKELRQQMVSPGVLSPVLRHGIHMGQEAEMVTDSLRALWLEASGYAAQVFEFVSLEHTSKNKMILGVKKPRLESREPILARIKALKEFYGIKTQALETYL